MKILVFIKQVPDTDDVKLDPNTGNLQREGVQSILNPLDANSIECAMQLKRKYGATVAAISMGPPQAEAVLKKALHSAATRLTFSLTVLLAEQTLSLLHTHLQKPQKRSVITIFCSSASMQPTAILPRPVPQPQLFLAFRRSRLQPASILKTAGSCVTGYLRTTAKR